MSEPGNIPDINALLSHIREMVGEMNPLWKNLLFTPDTHLEKELGLDSMSRIELCTRLESAYGLELDETVVARATTARTLLNVIHKQQITAANTTVIPANGSNGSDELLMGSFGQLEEPEEDTFKHSAGEWLYALYCWPVFFVVVTLTWIIVVLAPFASWRRKLAHLFARSLFLLTFTPLRVNGREHLDPATTCIIAANHSSYLDGFIVAAALNIPIHFIVKGELTRNMPARILLRRIGVEFVDRFNSNHGASDVRRITHQAENGKTIVFFPEGTFTTFAGLQPFRMGAFVTAARANLPLIPVAIRGARNIIRGSDWFPQRGRIDVTIRPSILPQGTGFQSALDLRDATRTEIARYCGEPDLIEADYQSSDDTENSSVSRADGQ